LNAKDGQKAILSSKSADKDKKVTNSTNSKTASEGMDKHKETKGKMGLKEDKRSRSRRVHLRVLKPSECLVSLAVCSVP
jgi:hypothetical protein